MNGHAYFVRRPRVIQDLRKPHLLNDERPFSVVKEITLPWIDYENFISDMVADRLFLEDSASLCVEEPPTVKCLFVKPRHRNEGVLVVPNGPFVAMAAYYIAEMDE